MKKFVMNADYLSDFLFDITDMETSEYYMAAMLLRKQAKKIEDLENEIKNLVKTLDNVLEELLKVKNERL